MQELSIHWTDISELNLTNNTEFEDILWRSVFKLTHIHDNIHLLLVTETEFEKPVLFPTLQKYTHISPPDRGNTVSPNERW